MSTVTRREFLDRSTQVGLGMAAGAALFAAPRVAKAVSPNEKITVGIVGVGGRGSALAMGFATRPDCHVAYLADVDATIFDMDSSPGYLAQFPKELLGPRAQGVAKAQGKPPKAVQDFRKVLDDKSVDAVVIATPDHWHALATIWACQAGKDVYVEKPPSHNCWEGRKMVEAARKYKRIVQVGTQNRSAAYNMRGHASTSRTASWARSTSAASSTRRTGPTSPCRPTAIRPRASTGTCGTARRPSTSTTPRSATTGTTSGATPAATSSTTASTRSTWPAGCWASTIRSRSTRPAGGSTSQGAAETPDTQMAVFDFDNLVMTFELTLYTPYMLKISPTSRDATPTVSLLAAVRRRGSRSTAARA